MFCKKCGEAIDKDSIYCPKCGEKLKVDRKRFSLPKIKKGEIKDFLTNNPKGKILKRILVVLIGAATLAILFFSLIYISNFANEKFGFKNQFISDCYFRRGTKLLYNQDKPVKTMENYDKALLFVPDENKYYKINIYIQRVKVLSIYLRDYYEAIKNSTIAIELEKERLNQYKEDYKGKYFRLADLYRQRASLATAETLWLYTYDDAINDMTEAIKIHPNWYILYFERLQLRNEKDYEGNIEDLTGMLNTTTEKNDDLTKGEIYEHIAEFYKKLGKSDLALKNYDLAIELAPDNPEIYLRAAGALPLSSEEEGQIKYLSKAKELYKKSGDEARANYCANRINEIKSRLAFEERRKKIDAENERTFTRLKALGIM